MARGSAAHHQLRSTTVGGGAWRGGGCVGRCDHAGRLESGEGVRRGAGTHGVASSPRAPGTARRRRRDADARTPRPNYKAPPSYSLLEIANSSRENTNENTRCTLCRYPPSNSSLSATSAPTGEPRAAQINGARHLDALRRRSSDGPRALHHRRWVGSRAEWAARQACTVVPGQLQPQPLLPGAVHFRRRPLRRVRSDPLRAAVDRLSASHRARLRLGAFLLPALWPPAAGQDVRAHHDRLR